MVVKMFAVYDEAVKAYMQPFFAPSQRDAVFAFEQAVNDPKTTLSKSPADYHLFCLGEFCDDSGTIVLPQTPENLGCAVKFVKKELVNQATQ